MKKHDNMKQLHCVFSYCLWKFSNCSNILDRKKVWYGKHFSKENRSHLSNCIFLKYFYHHSYDFDLDSWIISQTLREVNEQFSFDICDTIVFHLPSTLSHWNIQDNVLKISHSLDNWNNGIVIISISLSSTVSST